MLVFFFNDTATTEIYTLSLHDALPIYEPPQGAQQGGSRPPRAGRRPGACRGGVLSLRHRPLDRKSTRLNSSHANISYAVFCLKKKLVYQQLLLIHEQSDTKAERTLLLT